ncbi:MAG: phosphohydrolase [Geobacteraceae bacterium GWC2_58_44]|nr:MAG: phosphohydrolase [Geobacteraceae bacterium GWC2_58_44]
MTAQTSRTPYKVLLVDDEENIVRSITRLLLEEELDLDVMSATSGAQGLEALGKHPDVALILSDQRMPGMSGAEFLQKAREIAPDAVRMVLTGYADMAATMDAINKGGTSRYLTKPWDDNVLRRTIVEGVEQYRLVQENRSLTARVEEQNRELAEWNAGLKGRVLEQTSTIRRQNQELQERNRLIGDSFRHTILAFSRLIELHSSRLQEHTRNVTELAVQGARALGLGAQQIETVRTAALLHDVGVIGIASEILDKRMEGMPREELDIFLQHAVRGQTAVDAVQELREAGLLIRHHHEQYDGRGFPDRISGQAIPLGARIIAFADYVDRELEEQRGEVAVTAVLAKAARELGTKLDPALYAVLEPHIRALYIPARSRRAEAAEKELRPKQLLEGMTITRNLYSGSGLLLWTKGTVLDAAKIMTVVRHYNIDPPQGGVYVSWRPVASETPSLLDPKSAVAELELKPRQLKEGMRITRNIYSGTGLLLLTEGTVLDASSIVAVTRYYDIDPPSGGIYVSMEQSALPAPAQEAP